MRFWTDLGEDCSNCFRSCPFNIQPEKRFRLSRWLIKQTQIFNRGLVSLSSFMVMNWILLVPDVY